MHVAFADHQVANVTPRSRRARSGGGPLAGARARPPHRREPVLRDPAASSAFPFDGSALVVWDTGIPAPPTTNTPPRAGKDPHSAPRNSPTARRQKSEFLKPDGSVIDVCDGAPCVP